jgi:hypothetical protein
MIGDKPVLSLTVASCRLGPRASLRFILVDS